MERLLQRKMNENCKLLNMAMIEDVWTGHQEDEIKNSKSRILMDIR